jgi:hypothetical protein
VATTPVPLSSPDVSAKMADAVARSSSWRPVRIHPHPHAMLGRARAVAALAADLGDGAPTPTACDGDLITMVVLEGSHDLVLDIGSKVFHTLDGTATDAVPLAGRVHVGGERPLVILDSCGPSRALQRLQAELDDPGGRDLARLLRYDGAMDPHPDVLLPGPEIVVTPFWTPAFCETVIRAAEVAGGWEGGDALPAPVSKVSLGALSPRLFALTEEDLHGRICPRLATHWPQLTEVTLQEAIVVRCEAGEANLTSIGRPAELQVRGLVPLNRGYIGGAHYFPRQAWDDRRVPIGSLAMWPSVSSHPCRAESVTRGVRYTLILSWPA